MVNPVRCVLTLLAGLALLFLRAPAQVDTITILHLNDSHSTLAPSGPRTQSLKGIRGGIARVATAIAAVRARQPNVILLHAGDFSIGDFFYNVWFGVPELKLLASLGCDALTLGNHEFDLTPPTLQSALDSAFTERSIPVLSANLLLHDPSLLGLARHVTPFVVRTCGSHTVGIFGLTTPSANLLSRPAPAAFDTAIASRAVTMVDTLKRLGCDAVILLSHLGLRDDRRLAQSVRGITAIVGGHDHIRTPVPIAVRSPSGTTTWIVQTGGFYTELGRLQLILEGGDVRVSGAALLPLDTAVQESPTVASAVRQLTHDVEGQFGPVYRRAIATCSPGFEEIAKDLMRPGRKDTPVGNLVTDAFRAAFKTQIAVEAGGSTARPLEAGPIVPADIFRMVGYGFNAENRLGYRMATWEISGAGLRAGLEFGLSSIEVDDEFLLQVSGLRYEYDPSRPPGARLRSVRIGSRMLIDTLWYSVASNEFALSFLQYLQIPVRNIVIHEGARTEYQVTASWVERVGILRPAREGRIRSVPGAPRPSR